MAFHVRSILVAVAAVLLTAGYCAWQLSRAAQNHFNEQKVNVAAQQLSLFKKQVDDYLEKTANELTQLIQAEINQTELSPQFKISDFIATAVSTLNNGSSTLDWFRSKNSQITSDFFSSQLAGLDLKTVDSDNIQVSRIEAPDKRVYFTVSVAIRFRTPEGEAVKIATGMVPISFFQSLLDSVKGSSDEMILVDSKGYAISYPDQQYVGAKVDTHPVVKTALTDQQGSAVNLNKNIKGESVVGGYEKLPRSNLVVVLSSPVMSRSGAMMQSVFQIVVFCVAIMLLLSGLLMYWSRETKVKTEMLMSRIKMLEQRQQNPTELSQFVAEQTKKEILREFAFGVVQLLRSPLTAVIGQAQLLQGQVAEAEPKGLAAKIEREARQSRDLVEQLSKSFSLTEIKPQVVEAETLVMPVVRELQAQFTKNDIQIEENIKTRARVAVPYSDLKAAMRHVFNLMVSRLSLKNGYRKITINVEQAGPHVFVKICDNGAQPEKEFISQIFYPFKVGGLNFNLLKSLVESADGSVTARQADSGGLEIALQFTEDKSEILQEPPPSKRETQKSEDRIEIPIPESLELESIMIAKDSDEKSEDSASGSEQTLGGAKPLDVAASFALPEVPQVSESGATPVKKIVADQDLKVTIRKPKTRFES